MDDVPTLDAINTKANQLHSWVTDYVLTVDFAAQILLVGLLTLSAWVISHKLSHRTGDRLHAWQSRAMPLMTGRFHLTAREIFFLLLAPAMLWAATMIAAAAQWPVGILNIVASLLSAWVIIRFGSSIVRSPMWSRALAVVAWLVAALNIMGWLDPTVEVLDKAVIPLGARHLSLLVLLKGAMVLGLLLWLAGHASEMMERVLWRSQLTPSQKVLFQKLTKIVFVGLALTLGLNVVGIDLTALAVFSGALGIGIGFGLQKVFSNLMSGFILLMDKSIKPGDVIAIADTYGWVNRLGARYVSILTRDGKEHLIPNETLITQPVENWSYTDGKIRIHIPIGVSYTSDVPTVKQVLLDVANSHPRVLKNPAPVCLIKGFGDNSVNFEIRAWIDDPVNGVSNVMSGIYEEAWVAFKKHGIVVPFPQRDVHVNMEQIKEIIRMLNRDAT